MCLAKGVGGVTPIEDDIEVDYKTDRADTEIKNEIEQALRWNIHVDNYLTGQRQVGGLEFSILKASV